ncbi:MAG: glycine cleavage system aminomethyltransferase GcvT, partial [bacterium]
MTSPSTLRRTPLYALHLERGAKIVPFAGYEMPVQYAGGILKEHLHTRAAAGLFDVSHMGQIHIRDDDGGDASKSPTADESKSRIADALEGLMPVDVRALAAGRQKYGLLTNARGGILDDLMIQNFGDRFVLVVNAACKQQDFEHIHRHLQSRSLRAELDDDAALLALQGPAAGAALARLGNDLAGMKFMDVRELEIDGIACVASRSGYTGEDGFEISVAGSHAERLARKLLADPAVELIGLGARDSLRLEAGLCLYGHDITAETTPVEAALNWAVSKARRASGERAGGFPGDDVILAQMPREVARVRVGLIPQGRGGGGGGNAVPGNDSTHPRKTHHNRFSP